MNPSILRSGVSQEAQEIEREERATYIQEAHQVYAVLCLCASLGLPVLQGCLHRSEDDATLEALLPLLLAQPLAFFAILGSFFLAPRNGTLWHRMVLGLEVLSMVVFEIQSLIIRKDILLSCGRFAFILTVLRFLDFSRSRIASLPDKRLSRFITDKLLVPSFSTLALLIFFFVDPIRCWTEHPDERETCKRTYIGQHGLA